MVDEDWDKKVWKESWNANIADPEEIEINENTLNASKKNKKRKDDKNPNPKRRKIGKDDMIMTNIQLSSEVVNMDKKGSPEAYEGGKGVEHTIRSSAVKLKKSLRSYKNNKKGVNVGTVRNVRSIQIRDVSEDRHQLPSHDTKT